MVIIPEEPKRIPIKERRKVRKLRHETRIKKDIRGWIGHDYIKRAADLSDYPLLVITIFLTGGRATEILELRRGHFADMGGYIEVRRMPVFKKFDVLEVHIDPLTGKKSYTTELLYDERTFPILKANPLAGRFWEAIEDLDPIEKLFEFKVPGSDELWEDQYWQLYKVVSRIPTIPDVFAPLKNNNEPWNDPDNIRNLYPHWFRGMRAAQLRVEYNFTLGQLMRFFKWESIEMAQHYAGLSARDMAVAMERGKRYNEVWERMLSSQE